MNFCATYFIRINVFVGANKLVLVDCYVQLLFRSLAEKKSNIFLMNPRSYVRAVRKKRNECTSLSLRWSFTAKGPCFPQSLKLLPHVDTCGDCNNTVTHSYRYRKFVFSDKENTQTSGGDKSEW